MPLGSADGAPLQSNFQDLFYHRRLFPGQIKPDFFEAQFLFAQYLPDWPIVSGRQRCFHRIVGIVGSQTFGQDILNASTSTTARPDHQRDARPFRCRLQQHLPGTESSQDSVWDRRIYNRNLNQIFFGTIHSLADGLRNLIGLAQTGPYLALTVSYNN
jgi:hypothetical protein